MITKEHMYTKGLKLDKAAETESSWAIPRGWRSSVNKYRFSSRSDDKILRLDMVPVAQHCEYSQNHWIEYFKGEFYGV